MAKKRVLILGAGLSGLSAAWHLQRKNIDCEVFEKEAQVGGLCRSKEIAGFTFDYDGHLLHFKHQYAFNLVNRLLKKNLIKHQRNSWIFINNRYTRYPFQFNLYGLPPAMIKECLRGFISAYSGTKNYSGNIFLEWIMHTFGKGIADHFMIPYNSKFWTLPPQELTCEWLDGFIPVPSLDQVIAGTVGDCKKQIGYNAYFWYPKFKGINQLPLAFARKIKSIYTDSKVSAINLKKKEISINSEKKIKFDSIISTIALPELSRLIIDLPKPVKRLFKQLKWNSIFNLNLGLNKPANIRRHWVYFPGYETCFFRVGFPHNFSSCLVPQNASSLYAEVSYSEQRPLDKKKIVPRIIQDLQKIGFLESQKDICVQDINDITYAYPIYDHNYKTARLAILEYLAKNNLLCCGRYGSWRYLSMEDSIIDAKRITDTL